MKRATRLSYIKLARLEAWHKQGHRCAYCRWLMTEAEVTADHVKAQKRGGTDEGNIVAACVLCNKAKGHLSAAKFRQMLKGKRETDSWARQMAAMSYRLQMRTAEAVAHIGAVCR